MIALNLDLLSVGITAAGIGLLGFTVFFNNIKSTTNRVFLIFSLITIVWSAANYLQYQPSAPETGLWIVRIITFLGCWHAFSFFLLCYVFPEERLGMGRKVFWGLFTIVGLTALLTLSPFVFQNVREATADGVVTQIQNGPLIPIFGVLVIFLIGTGIITLARKAWRGEGLRRRQFAMMGAGTLITFACIVTFNLILPAAYDNARFLPLSAVFIFPFIACTAYAIFRYRMLNIKVLATEIVAFLLSIATLAQVMFSADAVEMLFHMSIFGLVLAFSILMVRSVIQEVRQREVIEQQALELEVANKQQENLLHFISHEVKGYLTESQAGFAAIVEGDLGPVSDKIKTMATTALSGVRRGVTTVMEILDASNLKKGTMAFARKPFDIKETVRKVVEELKPDADAKGVRIDLSLGEGKYVIFGDEEKLHHHVIRNLIDNAIKYTPKGSIGVKLTDGKIVRFAVQDSGVGITAEDMAHLFTEGGHGKDAIKVNVHSTGYGLYIAKQVVDAHRGKIWAESRGPGTGSTFVVELPLH